MQEMDMLDKGIGRETRKIVANGDTKALKMRLLEALHIAPHKMQTTGLPNLEVAKNKQNTRYQGGEVPRHKQNLGPIQADSLNTKKAPTKTETKLQNQISNGKKQVPASISNSDQKTQEKYTFSFNHREDADGSIERTARSHSSKSGSKKSERKKVMIKPQKNHLPGQEGGDMSLPANGREERLPSSKKEKLQHKKEFDFPSKAKKNFFQASNGIPKGSSDDTRETIESQDRESPSAMDEAEAEKHFPQSPVEEQDVQSLKVDDLMSKGFKKPSKLFSDVDRSKKSSSTLRNSKRVRIQEDIKLGKINLSSLSPMGTSRTDGTVESHEASESHMARSFSQMASVLEGFNTKLKSHTSKKSSEILSSALDKIRLQLQAVESQIQADVGKLTNVGKSKRKRLESTFQEQHQRLRLLHDKFKQEVNQQILDCRTTLEELEAYQLELKGTAERQKASHRKLLLQAEEAVKVQLSDADTGIVVFNKEANCKMNGLRQVLEEWLAGEIC